MEYGRIVCDINKQKSETHRTRLIVGYNLNDYPIDVTITESDITTAKTLINSTVSTSDAIFVFEDVSKFYLNISKDHYEYMQLPFDITPLEIIDEYNVSDISHTGKVYIDI